MNPIKYLFAGVLVMIVVGCENSVAPVHEDCAAWSLVSDKPIANVGEPVTVRVAFVPGCADRMPSDVAWSSSDTSVLRVVSVSGSTAVVQGIRPGEGRISLILPGSSSHPSISLRTELWRDTVASFQTSALSYVFEDVGIGWRSVIAVTYTNSTAHPVYFVNCNGATGVRLERWTGAAWQPVWYPILPASLSSPIIVPAGGTYSMTVVVFGGYPQSKNYPQFVDGKPEGVHRLVWTDLLKSFDYNRYPFGEAVPFELRHSNRFELL